MSEGGGGISGMERKRNRMGRQREIERVKERETVCNVNVTHSVVLTKRIGSILNIDVQFDKKVFTCN